MQIFGVTGESLGTIGPEKADLEREVEPEWKSILDAKPAVSVRKGIAWGENPPSEPTSTLVLTSTQSYFIDIRFSLLGPTPTSPPHYWAFAGTSTSTFPKSTKPTSTIPQARSSYVVVSFPCSIHTTWTRLVDSRGDLTTPDQGTTFLLYNGDCLEVGEMRNPETGVVEGYQEMWTSPNARRNNGGNEGNVDSVTGELLPNPRMLLGKGGAIQVLLAMLYRPPNLDTEPKGMILRVGEYCQGIVEIPGSRSKGSKIDQYTSNAQEEEIGVVRVERWTLQPNRSSSLPSPSVNPPKQQSEDDAMGEEEVWVRDPRSDYHEDAELGVWMPCPWLLEEASSRRKVGDVLKHDGLEGIWRVVEVEGW